MIMTTRATKNIKMDILLMPCIILRLKECGSLGSRFLKVIYPIIFFKTSIYEQTSRSGRDAPLPLGLSMLLTPYMHTCFTIWQI